MFLILINWLAPLNLETQNELLEENTIHSQTAPSAPSTTQLRNSGHNASATNNTSTTNGITKSLEESYCIALPSNDYEEPTQMEKPPSDGQSKPDSALFVTKAAVTNLSEDKNTGTPTTSGTKSNSERTKDKYKYEEEELDISDNSTPPFDISKAKKSGHASVCSLLVK